MRRIAAWFAVRAPRARRLAIARLARAIALGGLLAAGAGSAHAAALEVTVRDGSGKGLTDAVVAVHPVVQQAPAGAPRRREAVIEQVDRDFVPYVSVVQVGTTVSFPNKDRIRHHVYSFSPAKTFEIKLYNDVPVSPVVFDKPGVVVLGCNVHDWMQAHVLVVATPHFGRTGPRGAARIDAVAPGEYEVQVWHPHQRSPIAAQTVRVKGEATIAASFTLEVDTPRRKPKPPHEPDSY